MFNDLKGKAVIITGGTKGIGRAIGEAFGRHGAHVYLTHRWGSADEDEIRAGFEKLGAPEPTILEADVSDQGETVELIERVKQDHERVEAFISNVCVVDIAHGVGSYKRRTLLKCLEYSSWPLVSYTMEIKKRFGSYPRYVVGISSDGPDRYTTGYEWVAVSKAVMETFCRYMTKRLLDEEININILRTRNVPTDAIIEVFGLEFIEFMKKYGGEEYMISVEEVANAVLGLCSGLMDCVCGQVITMDKGAAFADTLMRFRENREEYGLT